MGIVDEKRVRCSNEHLTRKTRETGERQVCNHEMLIGLADSDTGEILRLACAECGESDPRVLFAGEDDNANGYERQRLNAGMN